MSQPNGINVAFFGSSLVSAYWNGAATYYRGIIRALHGRGHRVTFYEPDAFDRQRTATSPTRPGRGSSSTRPRARTASERALEEARGADLVVKASGVGVFDELLEARRPRPAGARHRSSSSGTSTPRPRSTGSAATPTTPSAR